MAGLMPTPLEEARRRLEYAESVVRVLVTDISPFTDEDFSYWLGVVSQYKTEVKRLEAEAGER
jgi:hypothetical protein